MRLCEYLRLPGALEAKWIPTSGKRRRHFDKLLMRGANWTPPPFQRAPTCVRGKTYKANGARECARRRAAL